MTFLDSEELEDRKEQKESDATQSAHPDMASIAYISSSNGPEVVDGISMELDKRDLWRTFYRYGTEMIITKVHSDFVIFYDFDIFFQGRTTNVSVDESQRKRPRSAEDLRDDCRHPASRRQPLSIRLQFVKGEIQILFHDFTDHLF